MVGKHQRNQNYQKNIPIHLIKQVFICINAHRTRAMGMIAIVVVGDLTQEGVDAIRDAKVKGKSKKKLKELLAELP